MASLMASFSVRVPLRDGHDLGAHQLHAHDVEPLSAAVLLAHVDHALKTEERRNGRGGNPMLAGTRLGDDAALAHPFGHSNPWPSTLHSL